MEKNIIWHNTKINKENRENLLSQKGVILWFTGLSGSGKSTIATEVEKALFENGNLTYILDGDNIRHGLNKDLDFSESSRKENIRRIAEVSKLFLDSGIITLSSFISPFREDRDSIRNSLKEGEFIEIYIKCSIEECERRDVKGLYKKARNGEIKDFTGINSPYEEPLNPEIILKTEEESIKDLTLKVINYLREKKVIKGE